MNILENLLSGKPAESDPPRKPFKETGSAPLRFLVVVMVKECERCGSQYEMPWQILQEKKRTRYKIWATAIDADVTLNPFVEKRKRVLMKEKIPFCHKCPDVSDAESTQTSTQERLEENFDLLTDLPRITSGPKS